MQDRLIVPLCNQSEVQRTKPSAIDNGESGIIMVGGWDAQQPGLRPATCARVQNSD